MAGTFTQEQFGNAKNVSTTHALIGTAGAGEEWRLEGMIANRGGTARTATLWIVDTDWASGAPAEGDIVATLGVSLAIPANGFLDQIRCHVAATNQLVIVADGAGVDAHFWGTK